MKMYVLCEENGATLHNQPVLGVVAAATQVYCNDAHFRGVAGRFVAHQTSAIDIAIFFAVCVGPRQATRCSAAGTECTPPISTWAARMWAKSNRQIFRDLYIGFGLNKYFKAKARLANGFEFQMIW